MEAWTIKQLWEALQNDLAACHTVTERTCCAAIGKKEIRTFAANLGRKLTPVETAILQSC